jgi:hypothetical protein
MSERKTGSGDTRGARGHGRPEHDEDEFKAATGYQPSTNQVQDQPLPASHHDDEGRELTARQGGTARGNSPAHGQDGEGDSPDGEGK